jgi:hypothetical protein
MARCSKRLTIARRPATLSYLHNPKRAELRDTELVQDFDRLTDDRLVIVPLVAGWIAEAGVKRRCLGERLGKIDSLSFTVNGLLDGVVKLSIEKIFSLCAHKALIPRTYSDLTHSGLYCAV